MSINGSYVMSTLPRGGGNINRKTEPNGQGDAASDAA